MSSGAPIAAQDVVLRFLDSIGRPAEAAHYLKLFQDEHPERFAVLHVSDAVMKDAFEALVANLRFLADLGLRPVVAFGALGGKSARRHAEKLAGALAAGDHAVAAAVVDADTAATTARAGALALVPLVATDADAEADDDDARFDRLAALAELLGSHKILFVGRRSGLQPAGGRVVSIVDLPGEADALARTLPPQQKKLLRQIARILDRVAHPVTVSVTSPLDLLRELFTVKGAGTLLRRGSRIERSVGWDGLDADRLGALIEEAFGRRLSPEFRQRSLAAAFVADDYRGAALVVDTPLAPYLSKFAVTTVARGEGVGRDLWQAITAEFPRLYWRSRASNPITSWYREQCDGLQRIRVETTDWVVLWRGLGPDEVPAAIRYCVTAPADFIER